MVHNITELSTIDFESYVKFGEFTVPTPFRLYNCQPHQKSVCRFMYIEDGEFRLTQNGCRGIVAHAGDIIYFPYDKGYVGTWPSKNIKYCFVEFNLFKYDEYKPFVLSDKIHIIYRDTDNTALEIMHNLISTWKKGKLCYTIKLKSLFYDLLYLFSLESSKSLISTQANDIAPAMIYLNNHYIREVDVQFLANQCKMCEASFRKKFKEHTGMTPIKYRNYLRIKKAASLLSSGDYMVLEAAIAVGIEDFSYFNRLFKSYMGINPKVYLDQAKKRRTD